MIEHVDRVCFQLSRCGMESWPCSRVTRNLGVRLPGVQDTDFESRYKELCEAVAQYVKRNPGCAKRRTKTCDEY